MSPSPLSRRISAISESATMAVDARAKALKAAGEPVIGFGAGEPDFVTPAHIVEAAVAACRDAANHRYTPAGGLPALKEALADKTERDSAWRPEASEILVTNGGKHAVYNACATVIDPGDEVLLPAPYWTTYPESITLAGGVPVVLERPQHRVHRRHACLRLQSHLRTSLCLLIFRRIGLSDHHHLFLLLLLFLLVHLPRLLLLRMELTRTVSCGTHGVEALAVKDVVPIDSSDGLASLPDYMVADKPHLVRVLPSLEGPSYQTYFVYTEAFKYDRRLEVFRDFLYDIWIIEDILCMKTVTHYEFISTITQ